DALFIYDPEKKKVLVREYLDDLIALSSPAWNREGTRIAVAGLKPSGQMDLYVFDRETKALTRLTNDFYTDLDPSWSPDGKQIVFTGFRRGGFGIYQMAVPDSLVDPFALTLGTAADTTSNPAALAAERAPAPWRWEDTLARSTQTSTPYEPRYGL